VKNTICIIRTVILCPQRPSIVMLWFSCSITNHTVVFVYFIYLPGLSAIKTIIGELDVLLLVHLGHWRQIIQWRTRGNGLVRARTLNELPQYRFLYFHSNRLRLYACCKTSSLYVWKRDEYLSCLSCFIVHVMLFELSMAMQKRGVTNHSGEQ